jgi:polar amino acid transport system ATP-binding protein
MVSINDVHKSFGELKVLNGVSFDVMKREVICIIGPSGSGKSTLIRCVNALNTIDKGSITVQGQEVHDPKLDKQDRARERDDGAYTCAETGQGRGRGTCL